MVTQSTRSRGGQSVLDEEERRTIVALLSVGFSKRMAASYVGCSPSTITRTAKRDPAFAEEVARASQHLQLVSLKTLLRVAQQDKYWRAAAWICERLSPQQFALRKPRQYTAEQVCQFYAQITDTLLEDVPAENRRRAAEKLARLFEAMEIDQGGSLVEEFLPEPEAADEPSDVNQELGPARPGADSEAPDASQVEACRPESGSAAVVSDPPCVQASTEAERQTKEPPIQAATSAARPTSPAPKAEVATWGVPGPLPSPSAAPVPQSPADQPSLPTG